ncbi:signal transduction histidine kinase [Paenochrobactrum gallinarii]|uniref:histidine kinase n=1 Tax=Paenochrobactrum gallinarii TaxID=643673 RepID=A0A841LTR6_9HYPH|nr:HAMP domain-containing sensor histidine kinase [Paenochrobactrum gallinarii]MBB6260656.1 signal transduction histidine kinase [Paenochrobactrum gallinarii]
MASEPAHTHQTLSDQPDLSQSAQQTEAPASRPAVKIKRPSFFQRLSNKFLLLTMLAVLVAQVLIFIPSTASMRMRWLTNLLDTVAPVALVLEDEKNTLRSRDAQDKILYATNSKFISITSNSHTSVLATSAEPFIVNANVNPRQTSESQAIWDAFATLFDSTERNIRVTSIIPNTDKTLEIVISSQPLRNALLVYARYVAIISLLISIMAAGFIYLIIHEMLLRPVIRMHRDMISFAEKPDDPSRIIQPEQRQDELGIAQQQLALMQTNLQQTYTERKHLADLGMAVSKINHDMRNILASAQLMSDSLAEVKDPAVKRFAPRLIRTLSRAISYSGSVVAYGRTKEAPSNPRRTVLHTIVQDVEDIINIDQLHNISFINAVPEDFILTIDDEQLFRILTNLCRNALQALQSMPDQIDDDEFKKLIIVEATTTGNQIFIDVRDNGPGLSPKAKENLFTAFRGSTRNDGTGLGLVIVQDLVRANGGEILYCEESQPGAHFRIILPVEAV